MSATFPGLVHDAEVGCFIPFNRQQFIEKQELKNLKTVGLNGKRSITPSVEWKKKKENA